MIGRESGGVKRMSEQTVGAGDVHLGQTETYAWSRQQSPPRSHSHHPARPTETLHIQFRAPGV